MFCFIISICATTSCFVLKHTFMNEQRSKSHISLCLYRPQNQESNTSRGKFQVTINLSLKAISVNCKGADILFKAKKIFGMESILTTEGKIVRVSSELIRAEQN